jgi:hypothetical protein
LQKSTPTPPKKPLNQIESKKGELCALLIGWLQKSAETLFSLPIFDIMGRVMKMDKEKELPKRKHPRLDNYDYSSAGAYFVTICTQNRRCVLSRIVGRGLAPAETTGGVNTPHSERLRRNNYSC